MGAAMLLDPEIVILTGAGISAESGLGTFRDVGGLWTKVPLEKVATPEAYAEDPDFVLEFYNHRRQGCVDAAPNPAHEALAKLQRERPGKVLIVTQNVDDLHERAGSPADELIHMHGELRAALCASCGHQWPWEGAMTRAHACPDCGAAAVRPDVVWFGEMPYKMPEIYGALACCAEFVSIGTSGNVYPAAGFVMEARERGAETLELNLEPSEGARMFHESRHGPASRIVPDWVEEVLGR